MKRDCLASIFYGLFPSERTLIHNVKGIYKTHYNNQYGFLFSLNWNIWNQLTNYYLLTIIVSQTHTYFPSYEDMAFGHIFKFFLEFMILAMIGNVHIGPLRFTTVTKPRSMFVVVVK